MFCPASLIRHVCLLWPASLIWWLCHPLLLFLNISIDNDSDDKHHAQPVSSLAPAPSTTSQLPRWVCSTREGIGDLVGDPTDQR